MVARHRRIRFVVKLRDKPGSLVQMLSVLAEQNANILTIEHDKLAAGLKPDETSVHIACEVGGKAHGDNVLLGDDGKVYFIDPLIRLSRSAEETIEWLTGFNPATMD